MTKGRMDRRTVIKTLGTAAATAALGAAGAPRVLGDPLPAAEPQPQAPRAQEASPSKGRRGGKYMADLFNAYGVTAIFHIPQAIGVCLAQCEMGGYPIRRILTHGEKASVYMADGYARVTGRPGICAAQGPGAGNQAAGLRDAYMAGSPVIAITGMATAAERYKGQYQVAPDDYPAYAAYTKATYQVELVERLPDMLRQAFRVATCDSPGPVALLLDSNSQRTIDAGMLDAELVVEKQYSRIPAHRWQPEMAAVRDAVQRLRQAQRPVMMLDEGVRYSEGGAEALKLAETLNSPVATTYYAYSLVPDNHPLYVGVPGRYSRPCANRTMARADLVLMVGTKAGGMEMDNWNLLAPGAQVIQIGTDPRELGKTYPNSVSLLGDEKLTLQALLAELGPGVRRDAWVAEAQGFVKDWRTRAMTHRNSEIAPVHPSRLNKETSEVLPAGALVFCDTARSASWSIDQLWINHTNWGFYPCRGTLGWAYPASLGGKVAAPDRPVVCICGDGGFWYHIGEIETAVRHGINTVTIVRNNNGLGSESGFVRGNYDGKLFGKYEELWKFTKVNLAKVAEAMGALGILVERPGDIRPALEKAFASGRPAVVDVQIDLQASPTQGWHNQQGSGVDG